MQGQEAMWGLTLFPTHIENTFKSINLKTQNPETKSSLFLIPIILPQEQVTWLCPVHLRQQPPPTLGIISGLWCLKDLYFLAIHLIHSHKRHTAFDIQIGKEKIQLKMNLLKALKQQDGSQSHQGAWLALPYGCCWIPRSKMYEELCHGRDQQRMETIVQKAVTLLLRHTHSKTHHKNPISAHRGQLHKSRVPSTSSKCQQQGLGSCSRAVHQVCLAPSGLPQALCNPLVFLHS